MMAAMVQSFPSPTISMLQPRPSSSEAFQSGPSGQQHQRNNQMPRNIYTAPVNGMGAGNYRGHISTPPVSSYTFTAPIIQNGQNPLRQHPTGLQAPRLENRTASAPSLPSNLQASPQNNATSSRPRPPTITSSSTPLNNSNIYPPQIQTPRDDLSTSALSSKQSNTRLDFNPPSLPPASYAAVAKSSPDRYRRNHRRVEPSGALGTSNSAQNGSAMPSGSGMATVGHLYNHPTQTASTPTLTSNPSYRGAQSTIPNEYSNDVQPRIASKDDMNLQRERQVQADLAKRYRRRSVSSMEVKDYAPLSEPSALAQQAVQPKTYAAMLAGPAPQIQERREIRSIPTTERPTSSHGRNSSNESSNSSPSTMQPAPKQSSSVSHTFRLRFLPRICQSSLSICIISPLCCIMCKTYFCHPVKEVRIH